MTNLICHRGALKYAPENTVPAFLKAVELEADGVEFDVHLTKDKQLVVCHDYSINETSDGHGKIKDFTLEELQAFDFGIKFNTEFTGTKIPTLKEVMDIVKGLKIINIELKAHFECNEELATHVVQELEPYNINNKIIYSSFDHELLKIMKKIDNNLNIGALFSATECVTDKQFNNKLKLVLENEFQAIHPHALCTKEEYVRICHDNGIMVNTWGAVSSNRIQKMLDSGCDSIITNEILLAKCIRERKNGQINQ
ncbi:MAG: glycerophosphodiester phosphodiesterase family protein [Oscillospiraceae bacterium]